MSRFAVNSIGIFDRPCAEVAHVAAPTAAAVAPEVAQVLAPAPTSGAAAVAPVEVGHVVAPAATAVAHVAEDVRMDHSTALQFWM